MHEGFSYEQIESPPMFAEDQLVARIQGFSSGGFEGVCYWRSADAARHNPLQLVSGKDKTPRAKEEVRLEKAQRAKTMVRRKVREIGADHLVTFTTRESENDPVELLTRFERFIELYRRALPGDALLYVAVPEPHPSNPAHWHVHAAVRGRIHVNVARGIWWSLCGGRGMGNVDARFIKCRAGMARQARIARYLSKYVTKNALQGIDLGGRHRYRSSRITLAKRRVLVFEARNLHEGVAVLLDKLALVPGDVTVFMWPDRAGFSFTVDRPLAQQPPPF